MGQSLGVKKSLGILVSLSLEEGLTHSNYPMPTFLSILTEAKPKTRNARHKWVLLALYPYCHGMVGQHKKAAPTLL